MKRVLIMVTALVILISAVLHLVAPVVSRLSMEGLMLVPAALIYGLLARAIWRGARWAQWLTLFVALFGIAVSVRGYLTAGAVPSWVYLQIIIADALAAGLLFVLLWGEAPAVKKAAKAS
ncbi:MAG: hypothetical protein HWE20_11275 [Gammaproteobacteria bacterium]|nr:hypothetical protein [Gammaproteobacteria bacterium]